MARILVTAVLALGLLVTPARGAVRMGATGVTAVPAKPGTFVTLPATLLSPPSRSHRSHRRSSHPPWAVLAIGGIALAAVVAARLRVPRRRRGVHVAGAVVVTDASGQRVYRIDQTPALHDVPRSHA